jgi:Sec-independent protein translocase protein TatA
MHPASRLLLTVLLFGVFGNAWPAGPDREGLLAAWAGFMAANPDTEDFESIGEDRYRLTDSSLPYEGEVRVIGAIVRTMEDYGAELPFSHTGFVEFELTDLPDERSQTQSYYYWAADRQTLYFSSGQGRWVTPAAYQASFNEQVAPGVFGVAYYLLRYGIWLLLIPVLIVAIVFAAKQANKARQLMNDAADINQQARQNIERGASLQEEVVALSRKALEQQAEANRILEEIRDSLRR